MQQREKHLRASPVVGPPGAVVELQLGAAAAEGGVEEGVLQVREHLEHGKALHVHEVHQQLEHVALLQLVGADLE